MAGPVVISSCIDDPESGPESGDPMDPQYLTLPPPFELYLDYQEPVHAVDGRDQGWRLCMRARVKARFTDPYVFRYQKISDTEVLFTGVASPADYADMGQTPDSQGFFRSDQLQLDFASKIDAYAIRDEILRELETLCCEMLRLEESKIETQVITISSDPQTNTDPS